MSLAQQIRDAVAGGPLPFRKLHEKVGGDDIKLRKALSNLQYNGFIKVGSDDDTTVALKSRRSAPPQGKGKKPAGKRGGRRMKKSAHKAPRRPYKSLADKHVGKGNGAVLRELVLDNYLAAGAQLRKAVHDQVEGIEKDDVLQAALANHERAEQLHAAARAA